MEKELANLNFTDPSYSEYKLLEQLLLSDNENDNILAIQRISPEVYESILRENIGEFDMLIIYKYLDLFAEISKQNGSTNHNLIQYDLLMKMTINILPDETYNSARKKTIKHYIICYAHHWMLDTLLGMIDKQYIYDKDILFNITLKRDEKCGPIIITRIMKFFLLSGLDFNLENISIAGVDVKVLHTFNKQNKVIGLNNL